MQSDNQASYIPLDASTPQQGNGIEIDEKATKAVIIEAIEKAEKK